MNNNQMTSEIKKKKTDCNFNVKQQNGKFKGISKKVSMKNYAKHKI